MADERAAKFSFQHLQNKVFQSVDGKDVGDLLTKWGMKDRLRAQAFSFDQQFLPYQINDLLLDFFNDPVILSSLMVVTSNGGWSPLGIKATAVRAEKLTCSVISLSFFDRLTTEGIVRETGSICKCFDEFHEDVPVSDELRKALLMEDSDNYELFSVEDRKEFLFHLFKHICLGGAVCQYEDDIKPYLDTTKLMYKDLVSVQKDPNTKDLRVVSQVYQVTASDDTCQFYPSDKEHEQTFSYLIVDPYKRHIIVFYHKYGGGFF